LSHNDIIGCHHDVIFHLKMILLETKVIIMISVFYLSKELHINYIENWVQEVSFQINAIHNVMNKRNARLNN